MAKHNSKYSLLLVYLVLRDYTDENHVFTQEEIARKISSLYDEKPERKAVARCISTLSDLGVKVNHVGTKRDGGYYLDNKSFNDSQYRAIVESIRFSDYIPKVEAENIVEQLRQVTGRSFESESLSDGIIKFDSFACEKVNTLALAEIISNAIKSRRKIRINLMEYVPNKIEVKLVPSKETYEVFPISLLNIDRRYKLLAFEREIEHVTPRIFEVNKINPKKIEILDVNADSDHIISRIYSDCKELNSDDFFEKYFVEDGDEENKPTWVKLLVSESLIDDLVYNFGEKITLERFEATSKEDSLLARDNEKRYIVTLQTMPSKALSFALSNYNTYILQPPFLRDKYKRHVNDIHLVQHFLENSTSPQLIGKDKAKTNAIIKEHKKEMQAKAKTKYNARILARYIADFEKINLLHEIKEKKQNPNIFATVGSFQGSIDAYLMGLSTIESTELKYICGKCHTVTLNNNRDIILACDLPDALCPNCGAKMHKHGASLTNVNFYSADKANDFFNVSYINSSQSPLFKVLDTLRKDKNISHDFDVCDRESFECLLQNYPQIARLTGAYSVEEYTKVLETVKPQNHSDFVRMIGLVNGSGTWIGNGELLLKKGKSITELISNREDLEELLYEFVGLNAAYVYAKTCKFNENIIQRFREFGIEEWLISSLKKIKHLSPRYASINQFYWYMEHAWYMHNHPEAYKRAVAKAHRLFMLQD